MKINLKLFFEKLVYSVFILSFFSPIRAIAYSNVTIIVSAPSAATTEFFESFKAEIMAKKNTYTKIKVINLEDIDQLITTEGSELVIALGVKALESASKLKRTTPVIGVFTPLQAFNSILEASHRELGNFTAIALDQPYVRQLLLIKAIMPEARKIGILVGPVSLKYTEYLKEQGEKEGHIINIELVTQESELIPQLNKALENNDVLLAIPDALIYNRETTQPILLTTYRYQKPIFAYSLSYVKAGALAAVYSSAKQLAKQAAEITIKAEQLDNLLPPPQAPKYFSITVNYKVARSLNLPLLDEDAIDKKMRQTEAIEHETGKN